MAAMSELTRQNLEVWTRMQESMLAAFASPRDSKSNGADTPASNEKPGSDPTR